MTTAPRQAPDPLSDFLDRLGSARRPLALLFGTGLAVALLDPQTKVILTLALGLSCGMLLFGPYSAAVLYATRLRGRLGGYLRWPVCVVLSVSAVFLVDPFLSWSRPQLVLAAITAFSGTVLGHDATLAVLELRSLPGVRVDVWMVVLFPAIVGLAVLAGYCSLGFGLGTYHLTAGLLR